ncbi:MAG: ankyrin repeat domain-containing protein [Lentimicrobiaceae bacterium]|nr:ankyrin repeat domain-containing protein [Lentimicrobiaceae bacterium]
MKNKKFVIILMLLCAVNSLPAQFARYNKTASVPSIYGVLDFIATHPINECAEKEQELKNIISAPNFDVNLRYNDYYPPLAYLVRKNHDYLGYFSKEYISDNVLKMLIEKGSRINTYDREGNSLMAFALETNNEYLSQWFIDSGIDLYKENKYSENIINKCIEEQNLSILKQITATADGKRMLNVDYQNQAIIVGNYEIVKHLYEEGVDINVNTLTVAPSIFRGNSRVYDYITQICANNAVNYTDLRKYKSLFPDKFSLIKSKIDKIYYDEVANIDYSFELIKQFVKTNAPMKDNTLFDHSFDFEKSNPSVENNIPVDKKMSEHELSITYRATYAQQFAEKHDGYDPDNKIIIANHIVDFNTIMVGLNTQIWDTYLKVINDGSFWNDVKAYIKEDFRTYEILNKDAEIHHYQIINAINMAEKYQNNNTFGNRSWFDETIGRLREKGKQLYNTWERDKAIYNADLEEANAMRAEIVQERKAKEEAEAAAQKFKEECLDCEIDKNKTILPHTKEDFLGITSEKPGKVYTKNGSVYEYGFDKNRKLIIGGIIFLDKCDTFDEMYEAFYKDCLKKKCPNYK